MRLFLEFLDVVLCRGRVNHLIDTLDSVAVDDTSNGQLIQSASEGVQGVRSVNGVFHGLFPYFVSPESSPVEEVPEEQPVSYLESPSRFGLPPGAVFDHLNAVPVSVSALLFL